MAHVSIDCRTQLALLAIEELDKGDFLMATRILTTRIRLEPNKHELYFERSICHHKLGDYQASLDDANAALRLNSADYNIHYQKGLALLGLSMFSEAITSFKKAIELRAKQSDSKLSDIFNLLRDAMTEARTARRRPSLPNQTTKEETVPNQARATLPVAGGLGTNNDPVDSTTDRPLVQPGTSVNHPGMAAIGGHLSNGNSNLVATNRNNQPMPSANLVSNGTAGTNRVSSSASHMSINHHMTSINLLPDMSSLNVGRPTINADLLRNESDLNGESSKSSQFEWNIRRSERIFLHHSEVPGTSGPQFTILNRHNESPNSIANQIPLASQQSQKVKTGSNPSSINSGRSASKRLHESMEVQAYQQNKTARLREGNMSHQESDVDVDDSYDPSVQVTNTSSDISDPQANHKRVMITPSSSMPATSPGPSASTSKDDSYSSKYKRLRRDRERARRGTSKLCTIKPSDLEELQKPADSSNKRFMRVIAPIDGWLYSGQLSVDDNEDNKNGPHYVVRLDGDVTRSSYLFSPETVLNDVIKEVRVKSVSELRKGARICCYWSRQYKCLSTGVVTSRTFEETKSLVSVKYDNGDLSALPLEDLRLLPPDYPKYMSNCDPLLLARSGDGAQIAPTISSNLNHYGNNRIVVDCNPTQSAVLTTNGIATKADEAVNAGNVDISSAEKSNAALDNLNIVAPNEALMSQECSLDEVKHDDSDLRNQELDEEEDEATIPPTDETIDFITSESTLKQQDGNQRGSAHLKERVSMTKDNMTISKDTQLDTDTSPKASEENNYGIEYRPWMFDGPPKRSKRHGRIYRDNYSAIRRGNEILKIGDSAELMPRDESILSFIGKIDALWATGRGEMKVRVRWYYRLIETEGQPFELKDGDNALFETDHTDENDVQSIYRATKILSWTDYRQNHLGHVNNNNDNSPKIFYLAGFYDPFNRIKRLRSDVREAQ